MNSNGSNESINSNELYAPVPTQNVGPTNNMNEMNDTNENRVASKPTYSCKKRTYMHMYSITHTIIGLFAIYLSFKCNRGINVLDLLLALFCPVLYIIYRLAICNNVLEKIKL